VEALDDLLENVEADFLAVEINSGPVTDHDGGFATRDDLGQAGSQRAAVVAKATLNEVTEAMKI
jgi:hypothetical protein